MTIIYLYLTRLRHKMRMVYMYKFFKFHLSFHLFWWPWTIKNQNQRPHAVRGPLVLHACCSGVVYMFINAYDTLLDFERNGEYIGFTMVFILIYPCFCLEPSFSGQYNLFKMYVILCKSEFVSNQHNETIVFFFYY